MVRPWHVERAGFSRLGAAFLTPPGSTATALTSMAAPRKEALLPSLVLTQFLFFLARTFDDGHVRPPNPTLPQPPPRIRLPGSDDLRLCTRHKSAAPPFRDTSLNLWGQHSRARVPCACLLAIAHRLRMLVARRVRTDWLLARLQTAQELRGRGR